jgi:peroxiredoxin
MRLERTRPSVAQFFLAMLLAAQIASALDGGVSLGDIAPDFKLRNVDGRMVELSDFEDQKGAIIVFTCNHCPYSIKYEDRILALNTQFAPKGYPVIAINPNDPVKVPEDSFENMKVRAREKKFTFPYLVDESQEVAKAYGATRTPHVFVVSNTKEGRRVHYIGAIDDNASNADAIESFFVRDAVNSVLEGKVPVPSFTKAIGCTIKWKSK